MSNESTTGSPAPTLEGLLQLAREQATGEVSEEQHQQDKERMLRRLAERRPKERQPGWGLRVALAALALSAVALLLVALGRPEPEPLAFSVQGAQVDDAVVGGGFAYARLRATDTPLTLAFEEGSRIVLAPGARGRLVEVGPNGAKLELALGQAQVEITPRAEARWQLNAGPYRVRVTGTAFSLHWEPERDSFEVVMQRGSVIVSGGVAADGVALSGGQRLTVVGQELRIARASEAGGAAPTGAAAVGADGDRNHDGSQNTDGNANGVDTDETGADETGADGAGADRANGDGRGTDTPAIDSSQADGSRAAPATKPATPSSWAQRVARGEFDSVVAEAEARGVSAVLAQASLPDLVALADAARYAGRGALAKQALQAQRKRFAGSSAARAAVFLLGRMADSAGRSDQALRHYQSYLAEGGGPLSREALGRAMLAAQRSGAHGQATQLARSYLRQHPQGPHASSARRLLRKDKDEAMP